MRLKIVKIKLYDNSWQNYSKKLFGNVNKNSYICIGLLINKPMNIENKICECCKQEFTPRQKTQKFCDNCLRKYSRVELQRAAKGEKILNEHECPRCHKMFIRRGGTQHFCDQCVSETTAFERRKIWEQIHPEMWERRREGKRNYLIKNYIKSKLNNARHRAEREGLEFNLTEEDIIIPEKCPILNVPLVIGTRRNYDYSPSIDRLDNSKGYVKGNIWVVSNKANSMKNSATEEELFAFCTNILKTLKPDG